MKRVFKKETARILTALLTLAVVIGFAPRMGMPVYAESSNQSVTMGAGVLEQNVNTPDAQTVWYGDNTWRVIGYDSRDNWVSEDGVATLLAPRDIVTTTFNENDNRNNIYSRSKLKQEVDKIVADTLSSGEKKAIRTRTLESGSYEGQFSNCIAGDPVENAFMWPLSPREASDVNNELCLLYPNEYWSYWWLRSPGAMRSSFSFVIEHGNVSPNHMPFSNTPYGVRPAFYLNLESVLLTSAAENGKATGEAGADALAKVANYTGSEWKATVLDPERNFDISELNKTENGVTFKYSGARTGANEYISAVIENSNGDVTYYGRLRNVVEAADASGEISINTEGKLGAGDTIYVFNEQYNGDKKTDYSSRLKGIYTVTFLNGYEEKPIKTEIVLKGQSVAPPADPTREGYTFKGWDKESGNVTTSLIVTAEWEAKTYEVSFVDDQGETLKTETVEHGKAATAPEAPARKGYTFKGWDNDFSQVTDNMTVTAVYDPILINRLRFRNNVKSVVEGGTVPVTLSYYPSEVADTTVTWTSSDENVLTVDADGKVRGVSAGKAKITATANDGGGATVSRIITVTHAALEETEAVDPTCTETGNVACWTCSYCHKRFKEYECNNELTEEEFVIPATGHQWGDWVVTKEPSPAEKGLQVRTCEKCSEEESLEIPKTDHNHELVNHPAKEATCKESGNIEYWQCEQCNAYYIKDEEGKISVLIKGDDVLIPKLKHTKGEPVKGEETPATCSSVGGYNLTTKCSKCGEVLSVERVVIPFDEDAHDWGDWKVVKEATLDEEGLEERVCANDDSHVETRVIPKIDPNPEPAPDVTPAPPETSVTIKSVTVNTKTVNAKTLNAAVKKAGGSNKYVTKVILGKKVRKVKKGTFKNYRKVTTIEVRTKKLKKSSVKGALKNSRVKTVKVKVGKKKVNKKYVKKYKKFFTKKIAGRKVKVK